MYKGFFISITKLPTGSWMAMVEASPGEADPVGKFDSQEAAVNAAKKYIDDRREERRGQP
ncbi:MAG: hypothetical protein U9R33_04015 [candidate division NC10 bacterium]|nr:hypothetical protein [candidate division NC10 bacterium]